MARGCHANRSACHVAGALLIPGILLAWLCMAGAAGAADVLTLASGEQLQGAFAGFSGGQFHFAVDSETNRKVPLIKVVTLAISPPVSVNLKRRGGRNESAITLSAYEKPHFQFSTPAGALSLASAQIASIEVLDTFARAMQHQKERDRADQTSVAAGSRLVVPTGQVTVVHFHMESVVSSVRQGQYAKTLAGKHDIAYVRVDLSGWTDAIATEYHITSAPQFWFYDRAGRVTQRLTDRFTDVDLETAFRSARP